MADWRLDARIAASDTDGGRTADSRRAKREGIERRLGNSCEQRAAGRVLRVVQRSNTTWGLVFDNHRWTQHRPFTVSGKRKMATTSSKLHNCVRGSCYGTTAAPGQAPVASQPLTAVDATFTLAAPAARWQS